MQGKSTGLMMYSSPVLFIGNVMYPVAFPVLHRTRLHNTGEMMWTASVWCMKKHDMA